MSPTASLLSISAQSPFPGVSPYMAALPDASQSHVDVEIHETRLLGSLLPIASST